MRESMSKNGRYAADLTKELVLYESLLISSGRGFDGIAYIAEQSYGYRNRKAGHQTLAC